MAHTSEPVARRTMFYEKRQRDGKTYLQVLPFYLVQTVGGPGKMFEPRDCFTRTAPDDVRAADKTVQEIREFDGKAKLFMCEATNIGLHSFGGWGWPIA